MVLVCARSPIGETASRMYKSIGFLSATICRRSQFTYSSSNQIISNHATPTADSARITADGEVSKSNRGPYATLWMRVQGELLLCIRSFDHVPGQSPPKRM